MKYLKFFIIIFLINNAHSQVLDVPEITQEQNQWCWAGVSKCILDYYGYPLEQCEIAEYARQVITWYNFGTTDCCVDPKLGCNYWNYNWGHPGSIQDILVHFGNVQNVGVASAFSKPTIISEISAGRPFVIRWGWNSGGGHFVVGHGIVDDNVYYMDPWFGEGLHISTYEWVYSDGNHTWTHTNRLINAPQNNIYESVIDNLDVYPNPAKTELIIESKTLSINNVDFFDAMGRKILNYQLSTVGSHLNINVSTLHRGIYLLHIYTDKGLSIQKFVKE